MLAASCSRGNKEFTPTPRPRLKVLRMSEVLETIHSYGGRGTAEGQIDRSVVVVSKVSDLRHSNDTNGTAS